MEEYRRRRQAAVEADFSPGVWTGDGCVTVDLRSVVSKEGTTVLSPDSAIQWGLELIAAGEEARELASS